MTGFYLMGNASYMRENVMETCFRPYGQVSRTGNAFCTDGNEFSSSTKHVLELPRVFEGETGARPKFPTT